MPDASDRLDGIVSLLYEAVLDDGLWPRIYRGLAEAVGAQGAHLAIIDGASADPRMTFSQLHVEARPAPEMEREYLRDFFAVDERIARLPGLAPGRLVHNDALFTDRERKTSATYNEFLLPIDSVNQLLIRLPGSRPAQSDLWVLTRYNSRAWDPEQTAMIARLVPHLARFLRLRRALARMDAIGGSLSMMLGNVNTGVILCDTRGSVVECNPRAGAMLEADNVLTADSGRLQAQCKGDGPAFDRILTRALDRDAPVGGSARLKRGDGELPALTVHIVPIAAERPDFGAERVAAMLLLIDPWSPPETDESRVAEMLGLTAVELRVACLLSSGYSVAEIAELSHRSEHTVRFHLKQIYPKTGVRRQSDLVRLVLAAGAP